MLDRRPILYALAVAAILHLSAVTLFRIVVMVPRESVDYATLEIVSATGAPWMTAENGAPTEGGQGSSPIGALDLDRSLGGDATGGLRLPGIELPKFSLEAIAPPRLSAKDAAKIGTVREDMGADRTNDSWAQLGKGVEALRETLSRVTGLAESNERDAGRMPILETPRGVSVYLTWQGEPRQRGLLYYPPLRRLWEITPSDVAEPLSLVIEVDGRGKVIDVKSPPDDSAGLVPFVTNALRKFEFEAAKSQDVRPQRATVTITAETPAP